MGNFGEINLDFTKELGKFFKPVTVDKRIKIILHATNQSIYTFRGIFKSMVKYLEWRTNNIVKGLFAYLAK